MKKITTKKILAYICAAAVFATSISVNSLTVQAESLTIEETTEEETTEEITTEEELFDEDVVLEAEVNGVVVKATAKAGVLPENAVLDVKEIYTTKAMEQAIEGEVSEEEAIEQILSYDITIYADGIAIQPSEGAVAITFEGIAIADEQQAMVVYTSDDASVAEVQDTVKEGENVAFDAEHFSIYNVVVTNKNLKTSEIISFVPQMGSTYLDLTSYFKQSDYKIEVANGSILKAYQVDGKLVLTAYESDVNKETKVTLTGKDKKLEITVYVTGKPDKTSQEFITMLENQIGLCQEDNKISDTYGHKLMDDFFKGTVTRIDSASPTGVRVQYLKDTLGEENLKNYSYGLWRVNSDKTVFAYAPVDFSLSILGDMNDAANKARFKASFEQVNQYILADCYTFTNADKSLSVEPLMFKLALNHIKGETVEYPIFFFCDTNIETDSANNQYKVEQKLKVIFEVADAYKADYDLTGAGFSGDICERVLDNTDNRLTGFGAVLKSSTQSRINGVIMTLAEDVTGSKDGKQYTYTKGTQVSNLTYGTDGTPQAGVVYGASGDPADQFGMVSFPEGTTIHLLVSPIFFDVDVYDAEGNVDNTLSGKAVCEGTFATPVDSVKAEDATFTYQFSGYSETANGAALTAQELTNLLTSVKKNISLYPIFTSTRKPVTPAGTPDTTDTTTDTPTTTVIPANAVPLAAMPAAVQTPVNNNNNINNQQGVQFVQNEDDEQNDDVITIPDNSVPLSAETITNKDTTKTIADESVPLNSMLRNEYVHWIMLVLMLLYTGYASIRIYQRRKESLA